MKRRDFLVSAAALAVASPVLAGSGKAYTEGLIQAELDAGKTVFVDFYTDWCTTCRAQQNALRSLKDENPAYEANISFVSVDYDKYGNSLISRELNIPRRSTLVVLKGDQEIGRIVAGTRRDDIKELLDAGLAAAVA